MRLLSYSLCISVILFSCIGFKKKYLIPEKVLVPLLVDLHMADGIGAAQRVLPLPENLDSTVLYNSVFEKYRVSREEFDSTMTYYTNHPDNLNKIYEKVLAELSRLESELKDMEIEQEIKKQTVIWKDTNNYTLPADGRTNRIEFNVPVKSTGKYTIYAQIKVFKDDESLNPVINAYFWYDNGTANGHREHFRTIPVKQDKILNSYSVSNKLNNPKITHIKGYIFDHSNEDSLFTKHAYITGIKIVHNSF